MLSICGARLRREGQIASLADVMPDTDSHATDASYLGASSDCLLRAFSLPNAARLRASFQRWLTDVCLLFAALPNSEKYSIVSLNVLVSHIFALASGASRRVRFAAPTDGRQNHKVSRGLALCTAFQ